MRIARHKSRTPFLLLAVAATLSALEARSQPAAPHKKVRGQEASYPKSFGTHFQTSHRCVACHNGISTPRGEDISIGTHWRTSMMAHAGRDPYWIAGVRRETIDHPAAAAAIQDECTICHMPMMRYESKLVGRLGEAFEHFPPAGNTVGRPEAERTTVQWLVAPHAPLYPERGIVPLPLDAHDVPWQRPVCQDYGPFQIDKGHTTIMRSSSTFQPTQAKQVIRSSEMCATCHTLFTQALDAQGKVIGTLPEQVPYQEWLHSKYKDTMSCQECHMPKVEDSVPITSVLGEPRQGFSRHTFVGGNFFMQRLLNRYRDDLAATALPQGLDSVASGTIAFLQSKAAKLTIKRLEIRNGRLVAEISIENLGGHKLPTAYPSRRVWLHLTVRDSRGNALFESGALHPDGSIEGNDNDTDPARFEPHYTEITRPDQVEIYEAVLADPADKVTTGLLTGLRFIKDNRLLPRGFDKRTADRDIAVHGEAETDPNFTDGGDTIRYSLAVSSSQAPFQVEAELWYQPIAHRWAMNLKPYNAMEPKRFVGYYEAMAAGSGVMLVRTAAATTNPITVAADAASDSAE